MRKFLFLLFSNDSCRAHHALIYAIDWAQKHGKENVRVIFEGQATSVLGWKDDATVKLLDEAQALGILTGTCATATPHMCGYTGEEKIDLVAAAKERDIALLGDVRNHAGISSHLEEGFEMMVF